MWVFGAGACGLTAQGDESEQNLLVPTAVPGLAGVPVASVRMGDAHALVCSATGELWTYGANDFGQLGVGDRRLRAAPVAPDSLSAKIVAAVRGARECV